MGFWARIFGGKEKAAEGEWTAGPYALSDGWLPAGSAVNFWQMGQNVRPYGGASAMVEACVSAYAQTVAMCPGDHWRLKEDGGRERVSGSALARILRKPNDYQSISDFLLNLTANLYDHGEAFALAVRNDNFQIAELHLMSARSSMAMVGEGGAVFYSLGGNEISERRHQLHGVPARDVLHVRLRSPRSPLRGVSPILAAALDMATRDAALQQQAAFYQNQAKPSFVLSTDQVLTVDQMKEFRAAWDAQTRGDGAGGTPILSAGMKPHIVSGKAVDAQLAETLKMTDQAVALAFRVPLPILGIGTGVQSSSETLMQGWIASGLGFALNHIEEAFGQLFRLRGVPDEYLEFDTKALLRSSFKDRVEAYARGVQGGIFGPDDARTDGFELPKVPGGYGEEPRVQQQDVPLSAWAKGQEARPAPPADPAPPAAGQEEDPDDAELTADAILGRLRDPDARLH